jgi:hypothetical protein
MSEGAQLLGDEAELVVVHPDEVARLKRVVHGAREARVHVAVRGEVVPVVVGVADQGVEERPQGAVAEAEVVVVLQGLVVGRGPPLVGELVEVGLQLGVCAEAARVPRDPHAVGLAHGGLEGGDDAARGALDDLLSVALDDAEGLAVGDDDEAPVQGQGLSRLDHEGP